jgi:hypothetical protein
MSSSLFADMNAYLAGAEPDGLADARVLDNWRAMSLGGRIVLEGLIDGRKKVTSEVRWIDRDFRFARTNNTLYRLDNSDGTSDADDDRDDSE